MLSEGKQYTGEVEQLIHPVEASKYCLPPTVQIFIQEGYHAVVLRVDEQTTSEKIYNFFTNKFSSNQFRFMVKDPDFGEGDEITVEFTYVHDDIYFKENPIK